MICKVLLVAFKKQLTKNLSFAPNPQGGTLMNNWKIRTKLINTSKAFPLGG